MQAFETTIRIRLDPNIVGPDAGRVVIDGIVTNQIWDSTADACDFLSELLSDNDTILDWGYVNYDNGTDGWKTVEHSDDYEEGEMFAQEGK